MGCAGSKDGEISAVDLALAEAAAAAERHFKVLLLGCGESGKSTLCRQIRLLGRHAVSERETASYGNAIRQNTIESMKLLLEASKELRVQLSQNSLELAAKEVGNLSSDGQDELTMEIGARIKALWSDAAIQDVWASRAKFYVLDAAPYYFAHVDRIASPDYRPTEEDMIMSRVRTTGISCVDIEDPPYRFSVVDVGGQRNERKKWIHCFDDVKAILFVVSLAGYGQVLFEDNSKNRLHESLELFEQVISNPAFSSLPSIFLVLNKKDLFEAMSRDLGLKTCFPDYDGEENNMQAMTTFIERKFQAVVARVAPSKKLHTHIIAARVRMDVKCCWAEITSTIKQRYAKKLDDGRSPVQSMSKGNPAL